MERHARSNACRNITLKRKQHEQLNSGYIYCGRQGHELADVVSLWAIPEGRLLTYTYEAYVPRWIDEAYRLYKKNNGYADMNLLDFINKMRPASMPVG